MTTENSIIMIMIMIMITIMIMIMILVVILWDYITYIHTYMHTCIYTYIHAHGLELRIGGPLISGHGCGTWRNTDVFLEAL